MTQPTMHPPEFMRINMAVAEKLGWTKLKLVHVPWESRWQLSGGCPERGISIQCPDWAGDIGAAWGLVEKFSLLADDFMWGYSGSWSIGQTNGVNDCCPHITEPTATNVICKSFLAWVDAREKRLGRSMDITNPEDIK